MPEVSERKEEDKRAWWAGDGVPGKPKIVINLSEQRLRYFKGDKLVGVSPISSGRENTATLNGKFSVLDKDIDHRSSLYGAFVDEAGQIVVEDVDSRRDKRPPGTKFMGASMRYFMRVVGGIGMHEGYLPGYPASHGCIRLPTRMAAIFFENTPVGTPVEVIGRGSLAEVEQEVPLGSGEPMMLTQAPPSTEALSVLAAPVPVAAPARTKTAPVETVRRAVLVENHRTTPAAKNIAESTAARARPAQVRWSRKPPPGTTLFLEN